MPLIALVMRRNIGLILLGAVIVLLAISMLSSDCLCANTGECFCVDVKQSLHNVSEAELSQLSPEKASRYRTFLDAWEQEYEERLLAYGRLFTEFHTESHTPEEQQDFDAQLAASHRDFLHLFQYRLERFREQEQI